MINNNIQYYGFVKIKVCKGDKVIRTVSEHNAGTSYLFKLLASTICGTNATGQMPKFLDVGTKGGSTFSTTLTHRISLSARLIENVAVEGTTYAWAAQFTAMIPSTALVAVADVVNINCLRLEHDPTGSTTLAEINLASDAQLSLDASAGYNYMIEWVMTFANAENIQ